MSIKKEAVKESAAVLDAKALLESAHTPAPAEAVAEIDEPEFSFTPNYIPTRTMNHLGVPRKRSYLIRHGERVLQEGNV